MMQTLTVGKRRGLAACATERGVFSILALDHRNNLRNAMNPANPERVTPQTMGQFKSRLIREVAGAGSAALLDPEYGAEPVILSDALSGQTGLVMAVEATGYTGDPTARESAVLEGWSVGKIRRMGASALKLLVYYHPSSDLATRQEELISSVAESCRIYDLPFFIEPLSYSLDPQKKLNSAQKRDVVIRTAERLSALDVDILKAEFPLDVKEDPDEKIWAEACAEVSQASRVPWVLLSAGVNYETYLRQVTVACQNGASGVMAGRAVWKEAVELQGRELEDFLRGQARQRLARLTDVCNALGKPWMDFYPPQQTGAENWYKEYTDL